MPRKPPATIVDVARQAGVSTATVSRLLNGAGPVSNATNRRIRAAIEELNYKPLRKRQARPAKVGAASTLKLPIAFLRLGPFAPNQGHSLTDTVIEGITRRAQAVGRSLSIHHVPDLSENRARQVIGDAEGVIIRTSNQRAMIEQALDWLEGIPTVRVLGENRTGRTLVDHVTPDNSEVGALAAEYLIEQGCRHLVFGTTSVDGGVAYERCVSFVRAAGEAGASVTVVIRADNEHAHPLSQELYGLAVDILMAEDRLDLVRKIAAVNGGKFGLFMPRDLELAMVMPQLQLIGVDFAGAATAIGCDHEIRCLSELEPPPATIDLHVEDVAVRAIRRLMYRIKHPDEARVRITVAPDVVPPPAV